MGLLLLHFSIWLLKVKRLRWFPYNSTNLVPSKVLGHYFGAMLAVCLACINVPTLQVTYSHLYGGTY